MLPDDIPLALTPASRAALDGDPLDLGTGLFVMEHTDLALPATRSAQCGILPVLDRCANTLLFGRDANRNLTSIRSPSGHWIELSYDASNRVTQAKDVLGRTVKYAYHPTRRLSTVTDAAG